MTSGKSASGESAVIVLANLMDAAGVLNVESSVRAAKAIEIFASKRPDFLVTCGWDYRDDSSLPIAEAFQAHILRHSDIPADRVLMERRSRDTVGDAYFTKVGLAVPRGWTRLHIVTSHYHVPRTQQIFAFIYGPGFQIDVEGTEAAQTADMHENETRSLQAFRDTFAGVTPGDDSAILQRLRDCHPFYNGTVYPRI